MMQTENILNDSRLRALENHTRVNLLRPTLGTTTINGVTCTNNGDGTYTLNGTATSQANFTLMSRMTNTYKGMKVVGCPSGGSSGTYNVLITYTSSSGAWLGEAYDESVGYIVADYDYIEFGILIRSGTVCNNLVFKPMLTTDLTATYDDFVSYEDSLQPGINMGLQMDLLWENASPSSEFPMQDVYLDVGKYKLLNIVACNSTNNNYNILNFIVTIIVYKSYALAVNQRLGMWRDLVISPNYVRFSECGTENGTNNSCLIPYKIYGVK